jgi:hypothetical protein
MTRKFCALALLLLINVAAVGLTAAVATAGDADNRGPVRLLRTVPIPGDSPLVVFDISWVDAATQTYFLADRSNATIDVIDARQSTFVRQIHGGFKGFTGSNDTSGPNGVVVSGPWLFVTDAPSRVVTIDLRTDAIVGEVSTGGAPGLRADELAYDPQDGVLLVVNNADSPPFATLIQVDKTTGQLTLGSRITFTEATNGAEQPVWDPGTRRFYLSIPEVNGAGEPGTGPDGAVARIDPAAAAVETMFPVKFCQPAGLTRGPHQQLLLGCSVVFDTAGEAWSPADPKTAAPISVIMDARTGKIDRTIAGVSGSDEVWFNRGDRNYYLAARANPTGPVLGVIDADDQTLRQIVPTFNTPASAPAPRGTAHSVAVDPHNNHVFVPLPANNVFPDCLNCCVAVFGTRGGD